jgi:PIN domain nuclease of toxin-antitoxin system
MFSDEIAIDSNELPERFHGDPADRLIVATARALEATLMTADAKILLYSKQGHVSAIPL